MAVAIKYYSKDGKKNTFFVFTSYKEACNFEERLWEEFLYATAFLWLIYE